MAKNMYPPNFFAAKQKKDDPDRTAVAIAYEPGEAAPKILATG